MFSSVLWVFGTCDDPIAKADELTEASELTEMTFVEHLVVPERELALAVAKVCVNEASWNSPADCALIWQIVEGRGRTTATRLSWLRRHSHRVLDGTCNEDYQTMNCWWSQHLTWSDAAPANFPHEWSEAYIRRWRRVRRMAWGLVVGTITRRPCAIRPRTWGGRMDRARALRNGLIPIECEGTWNDGYVLADI
jgi:hypothetical protein